MRNQTLMSRQLEYFFTLYRLKNYAAAAKAIPITYQGLKKSISKLEAELDTTLFTYGEGDMLVPTPEADILYEHTLKWTEDIDHLAAIIHASGKNNIRTLSICATIGALNTLGYSTFFEFDELHPDIRLNAIEYSDTGVDDALLRGEFGIGFTSSPFEESLVTTPLIAVPSAAWVNKNHPLATKESIELNDLAGETVMLPHPQYKDTTQTLSLLAERGIRLAAKRFNTDPTWSIAFAAEGKGIGLAPLRIFGYSSSSSDAVLLPIVDGYVKKIGLSHRRGHRLSADERLLWDFIVEKAKRLQ